MDWHAYRAVLYDTTYRVLSIRVEMCEHIYNLCQLLGTRLHPFVCQTVYTGLGLPGVLYALYAISSLDTEDP